MKTFVCSGCKATKPIKPIGGTGYGVKDDGSKLCYACCGLEDRARMKADNQVTLYYSGGFVVNWPGTLRIAPSRQKKGRHNFGGSRIDVWFHDEQTGSHWHGVQIGDNDILRCRKLRAV